MHSIKQKIKKLVPAPILNWYHFFMSLLATIIFCYPSRKIKVIGVTGTNGKSTVVMMVSKILEEAGYKIATSSSVEFQIGEKKWANNLRMTMPGRFSLQKFLRKAASKNCQYAVVEVSSEGIKQHRHRFINFTAAILTNVTAEHLESHGGFKNYLSAKGELFRLNKNIHIINYEDSNFEYFAGFKAKKKYIYGIKPKNEKNKTVFVLFPGQLKNLTEGSMFNLNGLEFKLNLLGEFNIYNALSAICLGLSQNISLETCKNALVKIKSMSGRMEQVISKPIKVFIDYAVTPDSLEKAYLTLKNNFQEKRLICILGSCGGGRDKWKRPILGKIASKYCDKIIITNEDPYDENPVKIINEIAEENKLAEKIIDRREAIHKALKSAKDGDVVIITGKGTENSMCLDHGKKIDWNDKRVVIEEFKKISEQFN